MSYALAGALASPKFRRQWPSSIAEPRFSAPQPVAVKGPPRVKLQTLGAARSFEPFAARRSGFASANIRRHIPRFC